MEHGCIICGKPVSPQDGIDDRCGHHRRQFLRNQAKAKGLPSPTRPRAERPPKDPGPSPLEQLTPLQMKVEHLAGLHADVVRIACILCVRERGGSIQHVEVLASTPEQVKGRPS